MIHGRRLGGALLGALCLVAVGCNDVPDTPLPDLDQLPGAESVVDYSTWPLARLESAVAPPDCAVLVPQQRHFRSLSPDAAAEHGFGMVEAYVELAQLGAEAPAACPFTSDEARSSAVNQAVTIFLNDDAAKSAYGRFGECLVDEGIEGAASPMEAELLVLKRYSSVMDADVATDGGDQGAVLETKVLDHADELLEFERRVATVSVRCQAAMLEPVADGLIAAQQRVIDSAPAEQKALLEG